MTGTLYLVATPIGNLKDISARCVETLKMVDIIAAEDTRVTIKLLNHLGIKNNLTSYYEHNKTNKGNYLVSMLEEGKNIAIVSDAGMPAISDPGEDLVNSCIDKNIPITCIPGSTAAITALVLSGLPTGRFCFEGFLSRNKKQRTKHLDLLKCETRTIIMYESPHKLVYTLSDLLEALGNRKIAVCREITKKFEEIKRTTISDALEYYKNNSIKGEFVLVLEGFNQEEEVDRSEKAQMKLVNMYINDGMDKREAIKLAAKELGVQKRIVYDLFMKK